MTATEPREPIGDAATSAPVAAIDLGTNSFHLVIAQPTAEGRFELLDREKEVVRLGSGSGDMKQLTDEAIDRGVAALGRFRGIADAAGAEIHAVATSAVREAENRQVFLDRARREAGVRVDVVPGAEEARLIRLGVLQAVPVFDRRHAVIDIGGGSTEFVLGLGDDVLEARSLKVGAIRITERFLHDNSRRGKPGGGNGSGRHKVRKADLDAARKHVRSMVAPVAKAFERAGGFEVAVGSSGTIVNLAEIDRALADLDPLQQVSNSTLTATGLERVVRELSERTLAGEPLDGVPGLDAKRADIILGGALVLEQAVAVLGIDQLTISDYALREGVLLDVLRRRTSSPAGHLAALRERSVDHVLGLMPDEREHNEHVAMLAAELFEGTRPIHGLGPECEEWLQAAALLCNVGLAISHDRHHIHSYYVIRNTDLLAGFTDHEIEMIALVARYHRKSAPKGRHPEFARLSPEDQQIVRVLAGLLRIAVGLDRTRNGTVRSVAVSVDNSAATAGDGRAVRVSVDAGGADAELELYSATARRDLLADALGVPVELTLACC